MRTRPRPILCLIGLLAVTVGATACRNAEVVASRTPSIRIGAGSAASDFTVMARALAKTLASEPPRYNVEIVVTRGGISSLESVQNGTSDCGFSYANVAYEAFAGRLSSEPGPLRSLRGVALVQISPVYFLVKHGSAVRSITDLRGRSVAYGNAGSASSRAGALVLNAFGLDSRSTHIEDTGFGFSELREGTLDAVLFMAASPSIGVKNGLRDGLELLPLEGPAIDNLRERYPFLHPLLIPADTYPSQHAPLRTVGVESLLLCREDVDAVDVHRVTQGWMTTFTELVRAGQLADGVTSNLASATPIPLHPGATAYYRSRQVRQR
jgi:TRAP transporter TAXI family solute receptor